jgi:hypothetical protein
MILFDFSKKQTSTVAQGNMIFKVCCKRQRNTITVLKQYKIELINQVFFQVS